MALHLMSGKLLADSPRVLLVYPSEAEPSVSAALVRVRGELVADGFEVLLVKTQPGTSSASAMGEAEHDSGSATVGLFLNADGTSAELWVVDKLTDKTVVRRVNTASEPTDRFVRGARGTCGGIAACQFAGSIGGSTASGSGGKSAQSGPHCARDCRACFRMGGTALGGRALHSLDCRSRGWHASEPRTN